MNNKRLLQILTTAFFILIAAYFSDCGAQTYENPRFKTQWITLTVKANYDVNQLKIGATAFDDHSHFEVQKKDGHGEWQKLAIIEDLRKNEILYDHDPHNIDWYRVVHFTNEGKRFYSKVKILKRDDL